MRYVLIALGALALIVIVVLIIGWSLPVKHTATVTAQIPATADVLFDVITRVEDYPKWRTGVKSVDVLPGPPRQFREHGADGDILFEEVERQPGRRLVTRIADKSLPFGGTWTYDITPRAGGSDLRITEDGEVYNPVFRFVSRYVMGHTSTMDKYVADLNTHFGAGH